MLSGLQLRIPYPSCNVNPGFVVDRVGETRQQTQWYSHRGRDEALTAKNAVPAGHRKAGPSAVAGAKPRGFLGSRRASPLPSTGPSARGWVFLTPLAGWRRNTRIMASPSRFYVWCDAEQGPLRLKMVRGVEAAPFGPWPKVRRARRQFGDRSNSSRRMTWRDRANRFVGRIRLDAGNVWALTKLRAVHGIEVALFALEWR
jgi:hypothetical protein